MKLTSGRFPESLSEFISNVGTWNWIVIFAFLIVLGLTLYFKLDFRSRYER